MSSLSEKLQQAVLDVQAELKQDSSAARIEDLRIRFLGRNGLLPALSKEMGSVPPEERKNVGIAFNTSRKAIEEMLQDAKNAAGAVEAKKNSIDVTLPGRLANAGHKHPISIMIDECVNTFRRMGFIVAEGPEIEDVYHNFDALNTPMDHPSRDRGDTFYFADGRLLRSQTSPVQIRVMESQEPPVRIVAPGRCFRRDTPDATHGMNFHQIEGLYIDKEVSLADLKSILQNFAWEVFGEKINIRLRSVNS